MLKQDKRSIVMRPDAEGSMVDDDGCARCTVASKKAKNSLTTRSEKLTMDGTCYTKMFLPRMVSTE